jgi:hypothetical protein
MSLVQHISDLSSRIALEIKGLRTLINGNMGDLSGLNGTDKTNLVANLNELRAVVAGLPTIVQINDASTASATSTWSINKIQGQINAAISALTNSAPTALDTLNELAAAIGNDSNFASTVTLALSNRVRTDINNQTLTTTQQANARTNISTYGINDIGDINTNFVAMFNAGLI